VNAACINCRLSYKNDFYEKELSESQDERYLFQCRKNMHSFLFTYLQRKMMCLCNVSYFRILEMTALAN